MKNIVIILFAFLISGSVFGQQTKTLSVRKFSKSLERKEVITLDVRTTEEFSTGHISKAINIDWKNAEEFKKKALLLPKNVPIYLYCRSGTRSEKAMKWLQINGFDKIRDLSGGFEAWKESGKEVSIDNISTDNIGTHGN
ncbi:rhodanese-like domain-containing protein [Pedobacter sp. MC2016-05]|uniref:rhodanese-like domain-containing protein n=1 Tax=Pedobacter sp. MC2016-05 TaxID=2994474 RepID=UPI0022483083|nr:rhodanese-like domain-containing protein [Pedobacter sp. MC2016-05]MCX2473515.1 rhodanese-like domain-containing protein [Pedobacter sp. MC2016-05]